MIPRRIDRWDARRDGPLDEASLERKMARLGFDVIARTYPAAVAAPVPSTANDIIVAVVRGLVRLTIDEEPAILGAGDVAFIPAGTAWRMEGVGSAPVLCLEGCSSGRTSS
jgi:mannose-6-phosphate isomerase-like protein (cupin superfamily)